MRRPLFPGGERATDGGVALHGSPRTEAAQGNTGACGGKEGSSGQGAAPKASSRPTGPSPVLQSGKGVQI